MATQHTPELGKLDAPLGPATQGFDRPIYAYGHKGAPLYVAKVFADIPETDHVATRLATCWNACAGIPDPETTLPALVEALSDCATKLEAVMDDEWSRTMLKHSHRLARAVLAKLEGGQQG